MLSLEVLQEVTGNAGKVNFIDVRVAPNSSKQDVSRLCEQIKQIFPTGRAMVASEVVSTSQGFRIARAMSWSTSLLAIIVGVLGVMNTMLMTVFERTHEIGILLAVGWKRRRIVYMVLCESALLGLVGGLVGVALGALGIWLLEHTTSIRGMLEPDPQTPADFRCHRHLRGRDRWSVSRVAQFTFITQARPSGLIFSSNHHLISTMHYPSLPAIMRTVFLVGALIIVPVRAEEAAPNSSRELSGKLSAKVQDGDSAVRVKMEIRAPAGAGNTVLQLQIKARRTKTANDVVYQVLWPKERKGESFFLRGAGDRAASGMYFVPPDSLRSISPSQMKDAVFGGDLAYADLIENFFAWEHQSIVGTEIVDRVPCPILESRPGKGDRSIYGRVLSWIDVKRLVPLRVEKYFTSGQQARRIDTLRVTEDDTGRKVAASLGVRRPEQDSTTEIEGSKSRHNVPLSDKDFTAEALRAQSAQGSNAK